MSRPEKLIDWEKVDHFLMAGCTGSEIAPHFDMHQETFYDRVHKQYGMGFTEYCALKRSQGDSLLKVKQFEKALDKDNTMLIWLGKQRLDQREPVDKNENRIIPEQLQAVADCLARFQSKAQPSEHTGVSENHSE